VLRIFSVPITVIGLCDVFREGKIAVAVPVGINVAVVGGFIVITAPGGTLW
jgi:hypothetical protein